MKHAILQLILILVLPFGCGSPEEKVNSPNSPQQQLVMRYVNSGWNGENIADLHLILVEDFERNLNGIEVVKGPVELEAYIQNYQRAFPNLRITVDRLVESREQVVVVWTFEGTNTGEFGEYVPTGKKAKVSGISLFSFNADNKIEREDTYYNELYLLQQLGYSLIPPNLE